MWHREREKKHFTILDSVAVSNLLLAFLPLTEGFFFSSSEMSVFYYIPLLDILIKNILFSMLARILFLNIDRIIG